MQEATALSEPEHYSEELYKAITDCLVRTVPVRRHPSVTDMHLLVRKFGAFTGDDDYYGWVVFIDTRNAPDKPSTVGVEFIILVLATDCGTVKVYENSYMSAAQARDRWNYFTSTIGYERMNWHVGS